MNSIYIIALLSVFTLSFGRVSSDEYILWTKERKLEWVDFNGIVDEKSRFKAICSSYIEYEGLEINGDELSISVSCYFDKSKSWIRKNEKSNYLLNHEQRHFDIGEIFARKFRKEISLINNASLKNIQETLNSINSKILKEKISFNKKYDEETKHSIEKSVQKKWDKKVDNLLDSLKNYSNPIVKIKIEP